MVHEALAVWRFPDATFEPWVEARCRHYGLADAGQTANAYHETAKLLQRFQAHTLYTDMSGADRRLHEVPYSLIADNGHVESGIVDALYQRTGIWTVVEFKTDKSVAKRNCRSCWPKQTTLPRPSAMQQQSSDCLAGGRQSCCVFLTMRVGFTYIVSTVSEWFFMPRPAPRWMKTAGLGVGDRPSNEWQFSKQAATLGRQRKDNSLQ